MDRRDFLKNSALTLGALSLSRVSALTREPQRKTRTAAASGPPLPAGERTFRKAMMWGAVTTPGTVLEKCQAVKAAGFDGIEPYSHMDRAEVLEAMRQSGLVASDVCCAKHWELLFSSPDPQVRQQGMEATLVAMEDAKAYGTDTILLVPGVVSKSVAYDQCWERSTACIRELLPEARRLGVRIAVENVWNNFLLSPLEAARYVDQFESSMVGFYFDVGNILAYGWPQQWIRILGERILRIHIKDYSLTLANQKGNKGAGFEVPLTEGDNDFSGVMAALRTYYRYDWLTIEHGGGESPEGLSELSRRLDGIKRL